MQMVVNTLARGAKAPIRLGLSAGGVGLSAMRGLVEEARRAVGGGSSRGDGWNRPRPPRVWSPGPEVRARRGAKGEAETQDAPPPAAGETSASSSLEQPVAVGPAVPAVAPPGAKQVDDEAVQVAQSAERGAEDGAGAQVRVDPPWDGYDAMTAADIRDRLVAADAAMATAVALYEGMGRGRVTIVTAAERRLGTLTA
jgi:hypothetical protein